MSGEKTEQASAQKIRKAREEGEVAKSQEFTGVAILAAAFGTLVATAPVIAQRLVALTQQSISLVGQVNELNEAIYERLFFMALSTLGWALAPTLGVAFVIAGFMTYVQVGALFTMKPLMPKMQKLNAIEGLKNMVNKDKVVDLAKNLVKIGLMSAVAINVLSAEMLPLLRAPRGTLSQGIGLMMGALMLLVVTMLGALLAMGIFDLWWQRHRFAKKQMMSKEDVKQEYKEAEGNQDVKGQRKQFHQELLRDPGIRKVPDADAVVVNPTHIAVAIQWKPGQMVAPQVVASGRGEVAAQIRAMARRWDIPIVRDVPLARALVEVDIEDEVPSDLYEAVAQVLQFVYDLRHSPNHQEPL